MSSPDRPQTVFRVADLPQRRPTRFNIVPDAAACARIADALELSALRKLRFEGEIAAQGKTDWRLTATLGATVVQPCVVTLEPVTTRIDEPVTRLYQADFTEPDGTEVEMPEDDSVEPLPTQIDLMEVLTEALALNIPAYPRVDGADPADTVVTEPGKEPLRDEDMRPFAGLAALRDQLAKKED
ncbi:YceD family protein [Aestuariivita boseongensis]|uniref:YceD family protein n=1 Tax=Aestuariivita boseongensis TaxID=1470562 RepID=UPI00068367D9|nr:DUF177 domain-containing protein [Aestuariivita boseongensis]